MTLRFVKKLLFLILTISFSPLASTKKCYITFSSKGGVGVMEKQECLKGATVKLNPCTFAKDEYYFKCWEDDFGKIYKDQDFILVDTDKHLHATWSKVGDANDPAITIKNKDDEIIKEIVNYQKLKNLDYTIYPNKWYTVGTNKWYFIGSDLKPKRGWHEEVELVERTLKPVIIPTPSDVLSIETDKQNYIIAPSDIGVKEQEISPSKKISTNVKVEDNYVKDNKSRWFYLDPDTCLLSFGWKVIDRKYYYFATESVEADFVFDKVSGSFVPNGKDKEIGQMYADEYTPDGRYVNSQGVMVNQYR